MPPSMKAWTEPGMCRWCGLGIVTSGQRDKRRTWHPECVKIYRIACFSNDQRAAVWERDHGVCARCETNTVVEVSLRWSNRKIDPTKMPYHLVGPMGHLWQADHIRPLLEANADMEILPVGQSPNALHEVSRRKGRRRQPASQGSGEQLETVGPRMTDRSESDRVVQKWALIRRLDEKRAQVHMGVIDTWRRFAGPRTPTQQQELEIVVALALHQLGACDRMEAKLKQ